MQKTALPALKVTFKVTHAVLMSLAIAALIEVFLGNLDLSRTLTLIAGLVGVPMLWALFQISKVVKL